VSAHKLSSGDVQWASQIGATNCRVLSAGYLRGDRRVGAVRTDHDEGLTMKCGGDGERKEDGRGRRGEMQWRRCLELDKRAYNALVLVWVKGDGRQLGRTQPHDKSTSRTAWKEARRRGVSRECSGEILRAAMLAEKERVFVRLWKVEELVGSARPDAAG
jgi:hypothetical protein